MSVLLGYYQWSAASPIDVVSLLLAFFSVGFCLEIFRLYISNESLFFFQDDRQAISHIFD